MRIITNKKTLHQKALPVASENISKAFSKLLTRTVYQRDGSVGFAGVQVGLKDHVFCIFINNKWKFFANAKITRKSWGKTTALEGCLSIPNKEFEVRRHNVIKVRYQNAAGEVLTESYKGFIARVIQHELDHLKGILISDKKRGGVK